MNFFKYIHAVGTGVKSNRDLNFKEAKDMMKQILNRDASNEQIAAFLLGWRLKPETTQEFLGVISACDEKILKTEVKNSIELGYPFDGKANNPYIFPLVTKILKKQNLNIVLTGDEIQPAKNGITVKDIVSNIKLSSNAYYFDRKDFLFKLHNITDIRNKLGLRTGLNTIEKLTGVANSQYAITGIFHKPYLKRYAKIFSTRYKSFAIIQGNEGTPEIFSKGRLWITKGEDIEEFIIDPEYFGINYQKSWKNISIEDSLVQLLNPSDEYLKLARLNAAVLLFVSQKATNINEAYEILS